MKANWVGLAVLGLAVLGGPAMAGQGRDVVAFCRSHPDLDQPDRAFYGTRRQPDRVPAAVAAVEATNWRCMGGRVFVCAGGASGSACQKMYPSRKPHADIRQFCRDNPGADFVATAVIGNSSSTWRCEGTTPRIVKTVPLDRRGFMAETWKPLTDAQGRIRASIDLPADPR